MGAGVRRRLLPALLATTFAVPSLTMPVAAFELFGIRLWGKDEPEVEAVADPVNYSVTFETNAEGELDTRLRAASTLLADEELPVSGSLGVLSKARTERERLVAALYEEARYEGVVTLRIDGRLLDELPPDAEFDESRPVPISVSIDPGPEFKLGEVRLAGDAARLDPADYDLVPGGDAGSDFILGAENRMIKALKDEGRPLARTAGRDVIADHDSATLDVTITLAAGPIAPYGQTTVEGTEQVDREFTEYMTGLEPGRTYSPEEIEDARERLLALEVFDSVIINEGKELDPNGAIPINVEVTERKFRYLGVGATFSSTEGVGLEGYWGHRNLFGKAERLRVEGAISGIGGNELTKLNYNAAVLFQKPGVIGPSSRFIASARTVLEHPDAYDRFSVSGSAGVAYDLTKNQTVSIEGKLEYSRIDDFFGRNTYLIASVPLQYVYDNRDDKLDPTRGFRALAFMEPSYEINSGTPFVKFRGEASTYLALDSENRFIAAGKIAAGSIVGASLSDIPADRRFYAGGGGSVRGYAYQGVGPRDPVTNDPIGGLSYVEGSVELRLRVHDNYSIVPFLDAGTVSTTSYPDFGDIKFGAGIGVRYKTPFGPLRLDVAMPLNPGPDDPTIGIYAGIGQAF